MRKRNLKLKIQFVYLAKCSRQDGLKTQSFRCIENIFQLKARFHILKSEVIIAQIRGKKGDCYQSIIDITWCAEIKGGLAMVHYENLGQKHYTSNLEQLCRESMSKTSHKLVSKQDFLYCNRTGEVKEQGEWKLFWKNSLNIYVFKYYTIYVSKPINRRTTHNTISSQTSI